MTDQRITHAVIKHLRDPRHPACILEYFHGPVHVITEMPFDSVLQLRIKASEMLEIPIHEIDIKLF